MMRDIKLKIEGSSTICIEIMHMTTDADWIDIGVVEIRNVQNEPLALIGGEIEKKNDSISSKINFQLELPDTICEITLIKMIKLKGENNERDVVEKSLKGGVDFPKLLFEIINNELRISDKIIEKAQGVEKSKIENFLEPVGDLDNKLAHEFSLFVFLGNCYLPGNPFFLDKCQVIPHANLGVNDIIANANMLFPKLGFSSQLPNSYAEKFKSFKPTTVLHFPAIKAVNYAEAYSVVGERILNIVNLLSFRRMSKVEIISYFFYDKTTKTGGLSVPEEPYFGNLSSGFGSESPNLMRLEPLIEKNKHNQFILNLYRHALKETRVDFIYFSFWNILEMIARNKGFDFKRDKNGVKKISAKGNPSKNDATGMVVDLIKHQYVTASQLSMNSEGKQYSLIDMVPLWNQHRNCTVHSGGCNPENDVQCDIQNAKIYICRQRTLGATNSEMNLYIRTLKRITNEMLNALIMERL